MRPRGAAREWIVLAGMCGAMALLGARPALSATAPAAPKTPPQNLQGTWELNPELTAQLKKEEPKPQRSGGGGGRGGGGGGFGRRGGGGGGGGRSGGGRRQSDAGSDDADKSEDLGASLPRLVIAQKENQVTLTDAENRSRVFQIGAGKVRDENAVGGPAKVQSTWDKDGSLLVEIDPDKGPHRTESYVVANDHKHLYLTVTISRRFSGSREVVRAYDLVTEPAPAAPDATPAPGAAPPPPAPAAPPPPAAPPVPPPHLR